MVTIDGEVFGVVPNTAAGECNIKGGEVCNGNRVVLVDSPGKHYEGVGCLYRADWWYYCESGCEMSSAQVVSKCDPKGQYCDDLDECTQDDKYDGKRCAGSMLICQEAPCPYTECAFWQSHPNTHLISITRSDGSQGKAKDGVVIVVVHDDTPPKAVWKMAKQIGAHVLGQSACLRYYQIGGAGTGIKTMQRLLQAAQKYDFVEDVVFSLAATFH